MRKLLILAAIMSMTFVSTRNVEAGRRNRSYTRTRTTWQSPTQREGFFARVMELERRKNAWLFGR
jgi:hypothetical protein